MDIGPCDSVSQVGRDGDFELSKQVLEKLLKQHKEFQSALNASEQKIKEIRESQKSTRKGLKTVSDQIEPFFSHLDANVIQSAALGISLRKETSEKESKPSIKTIMKLLETDHTLYSHIEKLIIDNTKLKTVTKVQSRSDE